MARELGSTTQSTTGNHTLTLNTLTSPDFIEFFVGGKSSDTNNHKSIGWYDDNQAIQACISSFTDATGSKSTSSSSKCISHLERVTGSIVEKVAGTVVSIGSGQFTINLTAADANYTIYFVAYE